MYKYIHIYIYSVGVVIFPQEREYLVDIIQWLPVRGQVVKNSAVRIREREGERRMKRMKEIISLRQFEEMNEVLYSHEQNNP